MIDAHARRNAEDFLSRVAHRDPAAIAHYEEWVRHPTTQALAAHLEILREGDVRSAAPGPGPLDSLVSLASVGARATVWETVHSLLFNFPAFARASSPSPDVNVESRPTTLGE